MPGEDAEPVTVLMVAIGGYGFHYLKTLLDELPPSRCRLAGVVDPMAERSLLWPVVSHFGIPACSSIDEFYEEGHHADLAVISSPIHWHVPQSLVALSRGSSVLCDKPLGATIQEARELVEGRDHSGRWVMIGYQWSYSRAILALKRDILAGLFGCPRRLSTLCCWPRDSGYYGRNDWAGRLLDQPTGRWVLDSPANNAMAHFLHNLLFVLGSEMHLSAQPRSVQAEMYRANSIESADTAACRVLTENGTELLFYASHATERAIDPRFHFEFEEAVITCGEEGGEIVALDRKGNLKSYGAPDDTSQFRKLVAAIDYVRGEGTIACGPEAAMAQTLCVNGMHDSVFEIPSFPVMQVRREGAPGRMIVAGLDDTLLCCYRQGKLPRETGVAWAVAGRSVSLSDYRCFPGGAS
ncbi:MAG: Gfo/Idh/MocA family oxidoreductase [Acidobacteriia bacterium]|nr:Gfo/Idh/MocA family oxidoreductase [Terriglobia bacterium]